MHLINLAAEEYATIVSTKEDALLKQVHQKTIELHPHAHMISGHIQGQFLSFISTMLQPKYILEIGTFTGYSALCLAKGLQANGELHTIELRAEDAATAKENFSKSQYAEQLFLHNGNALSIIPSLEKKWDLAFIDADKTSYIDYYELVIPLLNKNGIIIADNVLFHGQVLEQPIKGKNAIAIDAFNKHVANDNRTEQVLLTIRDGLMLIKKKNE
ncbi:MAG: O-methyltransferase [Chitinophagaceae bacterium]|nr:O-methyltransferase [Chitinophagaceae bacterium]MCW5904636.1 O-methyltransferase [Chitinophagaceae bacterium]